MAAAQSVDEKQGVIFQGLQQQTWFEPETLDHYIAALLKIAVARKEDPQMRIPDPVQVEKVGAVSLNTIQETLARFNAGLEGLGLKDADLFDPVDLTMLRVRISWVAEYTPPPPASNMPNPELMKEFLRNAHEVEAAKAEAGKPSNLDAQIKASLELFRQNQALKITTVNRLTESLWQNSSYIKELAELEKGLGGYDETTKEALRSILMSEANILSEQFTLKMLADLYNKDPSQAVTYFITQLEHRISRDDFLRTAFLKLRPEAKKQVLKEIEEKAHEAAKQAKPHAELIRKEQAEAAEAHGFDKEKAKDVENPFSFARRPISEVHRLTSAATAASVNVKILNVKLLLAAHHVTDKRLQHLLSSPFARQRIIAFLIQHPNPAAQQKYLLRVFRGMSMEDLRPLLDFTTFQARIRRLGEFTPQTIQEAAELRPDLLPRSVLRLFTETVSTPLSVESTSVIHDVATKSGVPAEVAAAHASGVSEHAVAAAATQIPVGHPGRPLLERFQQHFGRLQQALRPPKVPTEAPAVSESVASEFRSVAATSRLPTSFIGRTLRTIGNLPPVRFVTAPFRAVGNAVTSGVTGVRNWAKSQVIAGATSVGTKLVTWGAAQAAKAGIMGFAGTAATQAGKTLLAVAGGAGLKAIPFIGQAIGAVQAVGGATLGFLGSTLDFIRGKKSFGEWGASAFKSAGTLIGAAVGGLLGGAIGLLGLGVGAIPGALIGVVIGAMVGGMLTGGLAAFAKKPEEMLKSLFGLLLIGGFALAAFAQWALAHVGALIGGTIFAAIGTYVGYAIGSAIGFALCGPLCAIAGGWIGGTIGGTVLAFVGMAVGTAVQWFFEKAVPQAGVAISQLATIGAVKGLGFLNAAATAAGQLLTLAGHGIASLFSFGQIALGNFLGWIGQAGWTLGGGILGGIAGIPFGPLGMVAGFGAGAGIGSWLGSGGLNSLLSGIGPAMTNSIVGATNFLGALTAPLTASSIVATTTTVVLGGVAAAGGITALFVIPTILSALYVPPDGSTFGPGPGGGFADNASCPLLNPRISTTSYTSSTQTGHGSNDYWQSINSSNPCYWPNGTPASIPQGMGCYAPDDPGSVCYSVHYPNLCPYYGFAIDVVSLNGTDGTTPVYLPQINGQDVTWSYVGPSPTSDTSKYGWIHTYVSGEYKLILTHLQASVVGGSSIVSGTQIGLLHYQETSAGFNNTHVHIEFAINNVFQRPEDYFCGTGGP